MNENIKFIEVKSWLCAPAARWKLGAELWIDAIKSAAISSGSYIFITHPHHVVVDPDDHRKYAKENLDIYQQDLCYNKPNDRFARHIKYLDMCYDRVSECVCATIGEGLHPFVLAWDHSTAWATIAWIKKAHPDKRLGVIWIDAHADLHSPYTTPSGNLHWMSLAIALWIQRTEALEVLSELREQWKFANYNKVDSYTEEAWSKLCHKGGIHPMVNKEDVVFIGIRDIEPEEESLIKKYIKYFDGTYLQDNWISAIVTKTLQYLDAVDIIYVSFDIDVLDGRIVHGTWTPVPNWISQYQAEQLLKDLYNNEKVICLEFVEVNPLLDDTIGNSMDSEWNCKNIDFRTANGTAEIAFQIIRSVLE